MKRASEDSQDNIERTKSDEKDKQINPRILTNPKQNNYKENHARTCNNSAVIAKTQ